MDTHALKRKAAAKKSVAIIEDAIGDLHCFNDIARESVGMQVSSSVFDHLEKIHTAAKEQVLKDDIL